MFNLKKRERAKVAHQQGAQAQTFPERVVNGPESPRPPTEKMAGTAEGYQEAAPRSRDWKLRAAGKGD